MSSFRAQRCAGHWRCRGERDRPLLSREAGFLIWEMGQLGEDGMGANPIHSLKGGKRRAQAAKPPSRAQPQTQIGFSETRTHAFSSTSGGHH